MTTVALLKHEYVTITYGKNGTNATFASSSKVAKAEQAASWTLLLPSRIRARSWKERWDYGRNWYLCIPP